MSLGKNIGNKNGKGKHQCKLIIKYRYNDDR